MSASLIFAWGEGEMGQLGVPIPAEKFRENSGKTIFLENEFFQTSPLRTPRPKFVKIACGDAHSCAISDRGDLFTWGGGGCGQLGHSYNDSGLCKDEDGCAYQPAHTVCVSDRGEVFAFGAGACGQLGYPDLPSYPKDDDGYAFQPLPVKLPFFDEKTKTTKPTDCAAGDLHSVVLTASGDAFAFGGCSSGQLGIGPLTPQRTRNFSTDADGVLFSLEPQKVVLPTGECAAVKVLACGDTHTLFVTRAGEVFSCGANDRGQCGVPWFSSTTASYAEPEVDNYHCVFTPTRITGLRASEEVTQACGGEMHSLVLTKSGDVYAFGVTAGGRFWFRGGFSDTPSV
eukprot:g2297.t1